MSNLSFENIDRWLFEYMEGNLSPAQVEQLENFIFLHPELNIVLEAWKSAKVESENITFNSNAHLKPNPTPTLIWSGFSVIFILFLSLHFFNENLFTPNSQYIKENIDLTLLSEELLSDDFSYLTENSSNNHQEELVENSVASQNLKSSESLNFKNKDDGKSISKSNKPTGRNNIVNSIVSEIEKSNTKEEIAITTNDVENRVLEAYKNTNNLKSPNLDLVVESLNPVEDPSKNMEENTDLKRRFTSTKSSNKNSKFQKKLKRFGRKIKKMADQPVALRNSKEPHFHAPFMTGFNSNFGMVGTLMRNRIQSTSRLQFAGKDNQQLMNQLSWDNYIYALRGGLGIDVNYSEYGEGGIENFEFAMTYSPKFSLSKNVSLEPAVRFKTGVVNLDNDSPLVGRDIEIQRQNIRGLFTDGADPIGSQLWYRDIGTSLLLNTKWFFAGVTLDNVNRHYNNFHSADLEADHRAQHHIMSVIGTEYQPFGRDITYSGYIMHQQFGDLEEVWFGANVQWKWIKLGGGINNNSDYGASIGVNLDQFSLMYNIDYLDSRLLGEQLMSHQVSLRYLVKPNKFAKKLLMN